MTEIVSSPRRARSSVYRTASPTSRISIVRPSVSSLGERRADLLQHLGVVGAGLVQPEHGGRAGRAGTAYGERDPVEDRGVLGLAGAPHVAGVDDVLGERRPVLVDDPHHTRIGDLECLVVRAVLLGLLRHQPDVRRRAHRRGVERPVDAGSPRPSPRTARRRSGRGSRTACPGARRRGSTSCPSCGSRRASRRR